MNAQDQTLESTRRMVDHFMSPPISSQEITKPALVSLYCAWRYANASSAETFWWNGRHFITAKARAFIAGLLRVMEHGYSVVPNFEDIQVRTLPRTYREPVYDVCGCGRRIIGICPSCQLSTIGDE